MNIVDIAFVKSLIGGSLTILVELLRLFDHSNFEREDIKIIKVN